MPDDHLFRWIPASSAVKFERRVPELAPILHQDTRTRPIVERSHHFMELRFCGLVRLVHSVFESIPFNLGRFSHVDRLVSTVRSHGVHH